MARLGALMLTSVLLRVPRVFRSIWTVARWPTRYVEPAPCDAALADFIETLESAIDRHCHALAGGGTRVVEVHRLVSRTAPSGWPAAEVISLSVEADGGVERVLLHGPPSRRAGAARALVGWLALDRQERRSPCPRGPVS